jgi:hypothetical protein
VISSGAPNDGLRPTANQRGSHSQDALLIALNARRVMPGVGRLPFEIEAKR